MTTRLDVSVARTGWRLHQVSCWALAASLLVICGCDEDITAAATERPPDAAAREPGLRVSPDGGGEAGTSAEPEREIDEELQSEPDEPPPAPAVSPELLPTDAGAPTPEALVRFVGPEPGAVLSGTAWTQFEIESGATIQQLAFRVDDGPLAPQRSVNDSWNVSTLGYADGEHTLHVLVTDADGVIHSASLDVVFDNPDHRLLRFDPSQDVYTKGDTVELDLTYDRSGLDVSVDFSQLDSDYAGGARVVDNGDGRYTVSYTLPSSSVRPDGEYAVTARALGAEAKELTTSLSLNYRGAPEIPVVVAGAAYMPLGKPKVLTGAPNAPRPPVVVANPSLLTGSSSTVKVSWTQDPNNPADKLIVQAEGFSGYFVLPLQDSRGQSEVTQELTLRLPAFKPGFDGGPMGIVVGIIDAVGGLVDWVTEGIAAITVGGDGIQVSLSWDTDVDLDLEITDPAGNLIDFETPPGGAGVLDLDSNPFCAIDGINAENIAWEPGEELTGIYNVRVNLFGICAETEVNWELTASFCGITETHTGKLTAADEAPGTGGQLVAEFDVQCTQRVKGSVKYEKQPQGGGAVVPTPVPFAPIRVVTASGITTLAQDVTDASGNYDLRFTNLDQDDYYVEVEASLVEPARDAEDVFASVIPLGESKAHSFKTPEIDGAMDIDRTVDIVVKAEALTGAFNVREQARRAFRWATTNLDASTNAKLKRLPIYWTLGEVPPGKTSYFNGQSLFILSRTSGAETDSMGNPLGFDHDHFDDPVIMHEFMHYLLAATSFSGPGGPHSGPVAPDLAFSEGMATLFGQQVLGQPVYRDTGEGFDASTNLESPSLVDHVYTNGPALTGAISEYLPAAVIWDILDGANETHDKLANQQATTFHVFFKAFPGSPSDRDSNGVDFVDFVDEWRKKETGVDQSLDCLMDRLTFPYFTPASGVACTP